MKPTTKIYLFIVCLAVFIICACFFYNFPPDKYPIYYPHYALVVGFIAILCAAVVCVILLQAADFITDRHEKYQNLPSTENSESEVPVATEEKKHVGTPNNKVWHSENGWVDP